MAETWIAMLLGASALIHLPPVVGFFSLSRMEQMYDVELDGPDLGVLMRHRAVFFWILVVGLIAAMAEPDWRGPVILLTVWSDLAFVFLAATGAGVGPALKRVVWADLASVGCLVGAGALVLGN